MHAMRDLSRSEWERVRNAFSGFSSFLEERIAGIDDIRANGGGRHVMRRFAELNRELATANIAAIRRGQWIYLVASGLFSLGFAAALAVSAALLLGHATTIGLNPHPMRIGDVFMALQCAGMMAQPIVLIGTQLQQYQTASASLTRIRSLLAIGPELTDGPGLDWLAARRAAPRVSFEHVGFAYRADAPVLGDVSIALEPGAVLGLLGRTGSGKTTLSRLLFRLYDPVKGRITFDGKDIRGATLAELRGRIGLVTQEVQLFDASVRDNATLFDPTIDDARVVEVLTDLGLGGLALPPARGLEDRAGRRRRALGRRGPTARLRPGVPEGSGPGGAGRGLVAAGSRLRPADRAGPGQAAGRRRGRPTAHRHHHRPQALHRRPGRPHRHPRQRPRAGDRRAGGPRGRSRTRCSPDS